jgi:hypothetical protein
MQLKSKASRYHYYNRGTPEPRAYIREKRERSHGHSENRPWEAERRESMGEEIGGIPCYLSSRGLRQRRSGGS